MPIVVCEESPYDLINVLGPFSVILQPGDFCKAEFTCIPNASKKVR